MKSLSWASMLTITVHNEHVGVGGGVEGTAKAPLTFHCTIISHNL